MEAAWMTFWGACESSALKVGCHVQQLQASLVNVCVKHAAAACDATRCENTICDKKARCVDSQANSMLA